MAGTLFGIPLSQPVDLNGRPLVGAKLYIYDAGTTTPVTLYADTGLSVELPNPLTADSFGRIPQFWLTDGEYYRARLTDSAGVVQYDVNSILAIGPSSGGGGGGTAVDTNALFQTGDTLWVPKTGTRSGWVRHNGRTIGSATSGASERANSDCQSLYTFLWQNYADTLCAVSGGRGANAAADWAANKPIATLDLRNKSPFGLDDMGNSAASGFSGVTFSVGNATTAGAYGGEARHTLDATEIPSHTHTASVTDPTHTHYVFNIDSSTPGSNVNADASYSATAGRTVSNDFSYSIAGSSTTPNYGKTSAASTGVTVANSSTGGGGAHNNMPPFALGTWYVRL